MRASDGSIRLDFTAQLLLLPAAGVAAPGGALAVSVSHQGDLAAAVVVAHKGFNRVAVE